jgi:hypothetical protein
MGSPHAGVPCRLRLAHHLYCHCVSAAGYLVGTFFPAAHVPFTLVDGTDIDRFWAAHCTAVNGSGWSCLQAGYSWWARHVAIERATPCGWSRPALSASSFLKRRQKRQHSSQMPRRQDQQQRGRLQQQPLVWRWGAC